MTIDPLIFQRSTNQHCCKNYSLLILAAAVQLRRTMQICCPISHGPKLLRLCNPLENDQKKKKKEEKNEKPNPPTFSLYNEFQMSWSKDVLCGHHVNDNTFQR